MLSKLYKLIYMCVCILLLLLMISNIWFYIIVPFKLNTINCFIENIILLALLITLFLKIEISLIAVTFVSYFIWLSSFPSLHLATPILAYKMIFNAPNFHWQPVIYTLVIFFLVFFSTIATLILISKHIQNAKN